MIVLFDPEPADGGGAADGSQTDGSGGTDGGGDPADKGSSDGGGKKDEVSFSDAQLRQVREMFGLKEGQTIPSMITGAAKRNVGEMLGIQEGEDFADVIGRAVASATVKDDDNADDNPSASQNGQDSSADDALGGLKTEFSEMKSAMQNMQAEKEESERKLAEERRRSAIRDALGEFELRSEVRPLVTKVFEEGIEGPQMKFDDKGTLIVEDENGHPQPAGAFLGGYFEENSWALSKPTATGTGARGKGGAAPTPSPVELSDVGSDPEKVRKAHQEDPEGTAKKLGEELEAKGAKYGGKWGQF